MRGLVVVCALLLAVLAGRAADSSARLGCHPTFTDPLLRANLDRDRAFEVVTVTNVSCAHEIAFGVEDHCRGQRKAYRLPGKGFRNERRVIEANRVSDGREFFYILREPENRAPDLGTAALLHLAQPATGACPVPRFLFRYRADAPPLPPPRGHTLTGFDVELVELSTRYRGLEIRLVEMFGGMGTEKRRVTFLRYSPRTDRYVIYRRTL
jgi:hypothetical protein